MKEEGIEESNWRYTIRLMAGPMANIAFSSIEIIAATALRNYLSWPVSLVLAGGAFTWIAGELLCIYTSIVNKSDGDFGQIAKKNGKAHLSLAAATIVTEVALGAMAIQYAV